jgi:MarR family transcriptional regulator for hemolysin
MTFLSYLIETRLDIEGFDVKLLDIDEWCYAADVPEPIPLPIGLRLNQAARAVERAFDEALAEAGGTLPVWLILLNLKIRKPANQRELADAVGVREATLTHHLNTMDARGLISRARDPANRRIQVVTLTEAGEEAFLRLRDAAIAFDTRLRAGLTDTDLATLSTLLTHLAANVTPTPPKPTTTPDPAAPDPAAPDPPTAPEPPAAPGPAAPEPPTARSIPTPPWAALAHRRPS